MSSLVSTVDSAKATYVVDQVSQGQRDDSDTFGMLLNGVLGETGRDETNEHEQENETLTGQQAQDQAVGSGTDAAEDDARAVAVAETMDEGYSLFADEVLGYERESYREEFADAETDELRDVMRDEDRVDDGRESGALSEDREVVRGGRTDQTDGTDQTDQADTTDGTDGTDLVEDEGDVSGEGVEEQGVADGDGSGQETAEGEQVAVKGEGAGETEVVDGEEVEEVEEESEGDDELADGEGDEDLGDELADQANLQQQEQPAAQADISGSETRKFAAELSNIAELANRSAEGMSTAHAAPQGLSQTTGAEMMTRVEQIQQLAERFDQHVLSMIRTATEDMTITITPESLGKLVVSCRESEDGVEVHVEAEHASVCNLLQQQESGIRSVLDQNGFKLSEFDVSTGSGESMEQRRGKQASEQQENAGYEPGQKSAEHGSVEAEPQQAPQRVSKDGVWLVA